MLKMIKLEWKKNNIVKYAAIAAVMTGILLIFLIAAAGELQTETTVGMYGKSMIGAAVDMFANMSYMIFTGVMLAGFVTGAYEKKTINLMFSYPIKRRTILFSKMAAVWIFNVTALILSKIIIYLVLFLTKSLTHIETADIRMDTLSFWLCLIVGSIAKISITYIALLIGMKTKSSKSVIVASVIIVCLSQGNIGSYTLADNVPFYLALLTAAVAAVIWAVRGIETRDVM